MYYTFDFCHKAMKDLSNYNYNYFIDFHGNFNLEKNHYW